MLIKSLQLTDFRNFDRLNVGLRPRLNFFLGENGQGKTNLIEAVYLLCRGVSFRAADSQNLIRRNFAKRARILGAFESHGLDYQVDMTIEAGKKSAAINGKKANSATLMAHFPVVLFSPESLAAIKEGPEQRRQLADELLLSHNPRQGRLLREFQKALKSRNRLLRNFSEGVGHRTSLQLSLESLDKIYMLLATHLATARINALRDIRDDIQKAMTLISDTPDADISVDYVISGESALNWTETEVFDAIQKRHSELLIQERNLGVSLVGPQKHDIKLLFNGNDSRFYCSQGQQRALILALKIAQIVYHHRVHQTYPVLLLDDVLSELDAKKRVNLMKFLEGISAQILITATDLTWSDQFGLDRNSVFQVARARVGHVDPLSY